MLNRVLIVDDEPYIVDCMADLLTQQEQMEIDVCKARSAEEALYWLERLRVDLLLADIEMPDMSGIQLVQKARNRWPALHDIFLTAYENFQYAYEAMRLGVDGYILKLEEDEYIVSTVCQVLRHINEKLQQDARAYQHSASDTNENDTCFFRQASVSPVDWKSLYLRGFSQDTTPKALVMGRMSFSENWPQLAALIRHYIAENMRAWLCERDGELCWWLFQPQANDAYDLEQWLKGMLEALQEACCPSASLGACFVLGIPDASLSNLSEMSKQGAELLLRRDVNTIPFLYSLTDGRLPQPEQGMIQQIQTYVTQNLTGDLSLHRLSSITNYNPNYISRFFHECCGETLNHYIARVRLEAIRQHMMDASLPFTQIAKLTGFESRTYFNRFVKRMTGLPPQKYRESLEDSEKSK